MLTQRTLEQSNPPVHPYNVQNRTGPFRKPKGAHLTTSAPVACRDFWRPTHHDRGRAWQPAHGSALRAHAMLTTMPIYRFLSTVVLATLAACSNLPTRTEPAAPAVETTQQVVPIEALNADVRQDTIQQTICTAGYTASVRPSTAYTNGVKAKLLRERGQTQASADEYERDHIVPLALGGHPRNLKNLMLQP